MLKHLQEAWGQVNDHDLAFGREAYRVYHRAMRRWADHYGLGFVQTVEAFAALSPNNDYKGNLRSLSSVMAAVARGDRIEEGRTAFTISTYRACGLRAFGYLTGAASFLDTVRGRKITSFRHNILYPEESKLVTVDGHMGALWAGKALTMKQAVPVVDAHYGDIELGIQRIARRAGLAPCQAQASLWAYRKRAAGILWDRQPDLFRGGTMLDYEAIPTDFPPYPN